MQRHVRIWSCLSAALGPNTIPQSFLILQVLQLYLLLRVTVSIVRTQSSGKSSGVEQMVATSKGYAIGSNLL